MGGGGGGEVAGGAVWGAGGLWGDGLGDRGDGGCRTGSSGGGVRSVRAGALLRGHHCGPLAPLVLHVSMHLTMCFVLSEPVEPPARVGHLECTMGSSNCAQVRCVNAGTCGRRHDAAGQQDRRPDLQAFGRTGGPARLQGVDGIAGHQNRAELRILHRRNDPRGGRSRGGRRCARREGQCGQCPEGQPSCRERARRNLARSTLAARAFAPRGEPFGRRGFDGCTELSAERIATERVARHSRSTLPYAKNRSAVSLARPVIRAFSLVPRGATRRRAASGGRRKDSKQERRRRLRAFVCRMHAERNATCRSPVRTGPRICASAGHLARASARMLRSTIKCARLTR